MLKCICVCGRIDKVEPVEAVKDSSPFSMGKVKSLWKDSRKVNFNVGRAMPAIVLMRKAVISRRYHDLAKELSSSGRLDESTKVTLKDMLKKVEVHFIDYNLADETACFNWEKLYAQYPQACRLNWGEKCAEPVVTVGVRDCVNLSVMKNGYGLVDKWMKLVSVRCCFL